MPDSSALTNRIGAVSAALLGVLLVVGLWTASPQLESGATDQEIIDWLADDGNALSQLIGAYCLTIAGLASIVLAAIGLKPRIEQAGSDNLSRAIGSVVQPAFLMMSAMLAVGAFALVSASVQAWFDDLTPDVGFARFIVGLGWGSILVGAGLSASLGIGAVSIHVLRTGWLPSWFGWFGIMCALGLLAGVIWFPILLLPLWTIVAAVVLLTSKGTRNNQSS